MLASGIKESIGLLCALFLTLAIFTRLFGDNVVFRFARSLFIGAASGYITALVLRSVLWPRILLLVEKPEQYWYYIVYFLLGLMLLGRGLRKTRWLGSLPLGMLFGIGAAVTLGGALAGTLYPQTLALITPVSVTSLKSWPDWALLINGILALVGTFAVLGAQHQPDSGRGLGRIIEAAWSFVGRTLGRGLIMVLLGALYAGALVTFYTLFVGRLAYIQQAVSSILGALGIS